MKISREAIQKDTNINDKPSDARAPSCYTPPTLEKMQKLAQVTGMATMTGSNGNAGNA